MSTRNAIVSELNTDYQAKRDKNRTLEEMRLSEVTERCPEIGELVNARQEMIYKGLRMALDGQALQDAPKQMEVYNKRIRALLKANGFHEDYLQPIYDCELCQDRGYVGDNVRDMCKCFKAAYHTRLFKAVGLNELEPQTFSTFDEKIYSDEVITSLNVSQRDVALLLMRMGRDYAEQFPNTKVNDILMLGPSGVGKTFLMHAIAHRVLERGYAVICVSAYKVIELARNAHYKNDPSQMQALFDADLLMIDDLGTEPMMENITIPYLYNLINDRQAGGKHTVITTNLNKNLLKERYTERIASRLLDPRHCMVMGFVGNDVRKRAAE